MFCRDFSIIIAPLTALTGKGVPFKWGPKQKEAQQEIIKRITNPPVLVKPNPDKQFELEVDALQVGTSAVLYQQDPPTEQVDGTKKPGP